jgi:hypothetical protein
MSDEPSEPKSLSVPLATRYAGAWTEINARLQSRQAINATFATVIVSVTSVLLGVALDKGLTSSWLRIGSVATVALAWAFSLWIVHNDAIIGLLSSFCKALEVRDDPDNTLGLPAWHTDGQEWIVKARGMRKFSDWASMTVATIASVPSIVSGIATTADRSFAIGLPLLAIGLTGLASVRFLVRGAHRRKQIASARFSAKDGKWSFRDPESPPEMRLKA